MKKYILILFPFILLNYSCKFENKTNNNVKYSNENSQKKSNRKIDGYFLASEVDSLPVFKYKNLSRPIQPSLTYIDNKPKFSRDSLLCVFLEDSLLSQPIGSEGMFRYELWLFIDNQGHIIRVDFEKDDNHIDKLTKYIPYDLGKIKLIPAKKNGVNVPICILVNVYLDLYNSPSDIKKKLFPEE